MAPPGYDTSLQSHEASLESMFEPIETPADLELRYEVLLLSLSVELLQCTILSYTFMKQQSYKYTEAVLIASIRQLLSLSETFESNFIYTGNAL